MASRAQLDSSPPTPKVNRRVPKEVADHPQGEQQEEGVAQIKDRLGGPSCGHLIGQAVEKEQGRAHRQHHQRGQNPHLQVVPEGAEKQGPAVPAVSTDALHHRVVEGGAGRPQGNHRQRAGQQNTLRIIRSTSFPVTRQMLFSGLKMAMAGPPFGGGPGDSSPGPRSLSKKLC